MARVALTGANGYVGSLIAEALLPADLIRLVRRPALPQDRAWSFAAAEATTAATFVAQGIDVLVHAAWDMTSGTRPMVEASAVRGSLALLEAARRAGVTRIVFISTISAFDGARSVYGQTKRQLERAVLAQGGVVLRLGLVHGGDGRLRDGGLFGTIRQTVRRSRLVPMIGGGRGPQHLLDAARLQAAIRRAVAGDVDTVGVPITLADAAPIAFRDLVVRIAAEEGRRVFRLPIPWRLLHAGLRLAEGLGLRLPVRSDSVVSFIHADPAPDFSVAARLGL